MGIVNRDPDGMPDHDPQFEKQMRDRGYFQIQILCDEPGAKVGDPGCVSFFAYVDVIPRVGETVKLQDQTKCIVENVTHVVVSNRDNTSFSLRVNVFCVRAT